jgi:hypothetical protein
MIEAKRVTETLGNNASPQERSSEMVPLQVVAMKAAGVIKRG